MSKEFFDSLSKSIVEAKEMESYMKTHKKTKWSDLAPGEEHVIRTDYGWYVVYLKHGVLERKDYKNE